MGNKKNGVNKRIFGLISVFNSRQEYYSLTTNFLEILIAFIVYRHEVDSGNSFDIRRAFPNHCAQVH